MKSKTIIICLAIALLLPGCSIISNTTHPNVTENSTPQKEVETAHTPKESPSTHNDTQNEYIAHGKAFSSLVENILNKRDSTDFINSKAYSNNTIKLTIQVNSETKLYRALMDGAQAVAAVTFYSTTDANSLPRGNGSIQLLHQPELVEIDVLDPSGNLLGTYHVNPEEARAYRSNNRSANKFSLDIISSYRSERFFDRGSLKPSDYLNQSELSLFAHDYGVEIKNWTKNGFDSKFPIDSIRTNSRTNEMLHHFEWSREEYGEIVDSAYGTAYTAYWRTIRRSWAKTPNRLYLYIERPNKNKNFAAYMHRRDAYILLESNLDPVNRSAYLERDVGGFVKTDENPYRDIFYSTSESNDIDD